MQLDTHDWHCDPNQMITEDQAQLEQERATNPEWFWSKDEAISDGKRYGEKQIIARDAGKIKQFASFPDSRWLPDLIGNTDQAQRVFYECLFLGILFKGYLDIEYYHNSTELADEHLVIILKKVSLALQEYFPEQLKGSEKPDFGVAVATRPLHTNHPKGKKFKVSYHITFQNLFFTSPVTLGLFVKWFVGKEASESIATNIDSGDLLSGLDRLLHEIPPYKTVDMKTYSTFQQMRMPLSSKMKDGQQSTLLGVCTHFNPFSDELPQSKLQPEDVRGHEDLFLTLITNDSSFIRKHIVHDNYSPPQGIPTYTIAAVKSISRKRASSQSQSSSSVSVPPAVASFVSECLEKHGMNSYSVHGKLITHVTTHGNNTTSQSFTIPLCINGQPKCPLLQHGEKTHQSNNQRILIKSNGSVEIKCHSEKCKGRKLQVGQLKKDSMADLGEGGSRQDENEEALRSGTEADDSEAEADDLDTEEDSGTVDSDSGSGTEVDESDTKADDLDSEADSGRFGTASQDTQSVCAREASDYAIVPDEEYSQPR